MRDGGLQVIRHHDLDSAAEKLQRPDVRSDPVPQVLTRCSLGESVAAGSQHRHEYRRGLDVAARRLMNRNRGAGVIHKHLLAGAMFLPQHQV